MPKWTRILTFSLLVFIFTACSTSAPEAPPTPTRTPIPVDEPAPLPTATPTPEPAEATPTPLPPAATQTESPSEIVTPLPPDVNPLTGLKVEDESRLDRIPVLIKVSNSLEVRPQSGLSMADIVFEHFAEGGITRFTALFYGQDPGKVGSVPHGTSPLLFYIGQLLNSVSIRSSKFFLPATTPPEPLFVPKSARF